MNDIMNLFSLNGKNAVVTAPTPAWARASAWRWQLPVPTFSA